MSMTIILLRVLAVVSFGFAAWQSSSPSWNKVVAIGLMALSLSFIAW